MCQVVYYLATSLITSSTLREWSTLIGSAMVNCCVLWPCNVVAPDLHAGSCSTTVAQLPTLHSGSPKVDLNVLNSFLIWLGFCPAVRFHHRNSLKLCG